MLPNMARSYARMGVYTIMAGLGLAAVLPQLRSDEPAEGEGEATLKRFAERLSEPSGSRGGLRGEVLDFRLKHLGTVHAVRASALLSRLTSPLDKLRAADIPALERFPSWQPKELVGVIGEHRGRHAAPVTCVGYSADGSMVASGGSSYVRLWDARTLRLHALAGHYGVTSLAFSRDSKALVVGGAGGAVSVWDISKEKQLQLRFRVQACSSPVYGVAFAPDGKSVAAACFDNTIRLYNVSGKQIEALAELNDHKQAVSAVAYSPDGKTLASGSHDKSIRLWDLRGKDSKAGSLLEGHTANITALAYSSRGSLVSAAADGSVLLWGYPSGSKPKPRLAFNPKAGSIAALSFSPSGSTLALACADGTARMWSLSGSPRERTRLEGHQAAVNGVAIAPDGRTVATGSSDWTVRSWDVASGRPKERFAPWSHLSVVNGLAFSLDLTTLATGSHDRVIRLWELTKPDLKTRAYLKSDDKVPIYTVAYSPNGKSVAAGGQGPYVRQWDANTPIRTRPSLKTPASVNQMFYSPDSRYILTRSRKTVLLWDAHTSGLVREFPTEDMDIHSAAWSPDGKSLLTGHGVPLMKDGKYVFTKSGSYVYTDCMVRLFDVDKGEEVFREKSFTMPVYSVGYSVDGRQAFTGLYEPGLRRWEATPTALKTAEGWKGTSGYVHFLRFSPDGKQVVTSGLDGQFVLWDLANGKRLRHWTLQENVANAAYASDSRHLAVALATGVVYILRLRPADDNP